LAPDVCVLLPYRDAATTLVEALESVLGEPSVAERVAVDDGSVDEGPALVEAIARRDGRIRRLRTPGVGVTGALVAGWAASDAPFVARMDADDVSRPGRIERARAALVDDPSLAAVGTEVEAFPAPGPGLRRYVAWQNTLHSPEEHARDRFVEAPLCHPSVTLRRAAVDQVGGYREVPWPQDYDLWLRLVAAGHGLAKLPFVGLGWRHRPDRVSFNHPHNAPDRLVRARAHHLAPRLRGRPFRVWGAGDTGKDLARALEAEGAFAADFVDIDPRKIGRTARGRAVRPAEAALDGDVFVVVAVGAPGARDIVRGRLLGAGKREGLDFVCAA
jgi:glycosyltransferase involved in cell wall biosynthesis